LSTGVDPSPPELSFVLFVFDKPMPSLPTDVED